jgi:hypothetical protein
MGNTPGVARVDDLLVVKAPAAAQGTTQPKGSPRSRAEFLEFSEAIKKGHAVMAGLAAEGFQDNTPAVIWVGGSSSSPIEDDAREV